MRIPLALLALLASCRAPTPISAIPSSDEPPITPPTAIVDSSDSTRDSPPPTTSNSPTRQPAFQRTTLSGIAIESVTFDSRTHFLAVADQKQGPGSSWPDSRAAADSSGGIAAINGGFFTPEGDPLGKIVSNGRSTGAVNRASSLGAGFYVCTKGGAMSLIRRERFTGGHQALQSGPLLIENGEPVGGLSKKQSTARSFIAWDGGTRWCLGRSGACSLSDLSQALAGQTIGGTRIQQVLNLDGGRSSEIWASSRIPGGPRLTRPFWNKPVRNHLVLKPKS